MAPPRFASVPSLICTSSLLATIMLGCAGTGAHRRAANTTAPGLLDDGPSHGRAGTNPNAPFTLIDRTPRPAARLASMAATDAAPCSGKTLELTEVAAEVDGDAHLVRFAFVNQGPEACRIGGYPAIDLLDQQGKPVASLTVEQGGLRRLDAKVAPVRSNAQSSAEPAQVVLDPHGEAYFGVEWTAGEDCPVVSMVTMIAPGTTQAFTVTRPLRVCAGQVHVTALHSRQDAS